MKQTTVQSATLSVEKIQADIADLEKQRDEAMARVNALLGALSYATDAQIEELHGVPAGSVAAYKTVLADVLASLQAQPVEILLGNVA